MISEQLLNCCYIIISLYTPCICLLVIFLTCSKLDDHCEIYVVHVLKINDETLISTYFAIDWEETFSTWRFKLFSVFDSVYLLILSVFKN